MANQAIFEVLKAKFGMMVLIGLLFAALGFFGLMLVEKRYQTSMDFLVVQTNTANQDFYTQFKSSEYLGKVLGEALYSERFINAVLETGKVNAEFLPFDKKDRLHAWSSMVHVEKNLELGVISVRIKGDRERDTARTMEGISDVLINRNNLFRGGDDKSVEIRVLSGPITERTPTVPMIIKVLAASFITGFLLVFLFSLAKAFARQAEAEQLFQ